MIYLEFKNSEDEDYEETEESPFSSVRELVDELRGSDKDKAHANGYRIRQEEAIR